MNIIDCTNTPESGPNSPPALAGSRGSPTSAPIQEENEDPNYQGERGSINDFSLYTSPSMPNISLGRPHLSNAHTHNSYVCSSPIYFLNIDKAIVRVYHIINISYRAYCQH